MHPKPVVMPLPIQYIFYPTIKTMGRLALTNHLRIFYTFAYYVGATPYRIVIKSSPRGQKGYFAKYSWKPQQVFCAIMHLFCWLNMIGQFRKKTVAKDLVRYTANPRAYIQLAFTTLLFIYKSVTMKRFWINGSETLSALNFIVEEKDLPACRSNWMTRGYLIILVQTFFVIKLLVVVGVLEFLTPNYTWSLNYYLRKMVVEGRVMFCFQPDQKTPDSPEFDYLSGWDVILAVCTGLGRCSRYVMGQYADLCILGYTLTLWTVARGFAAFVNENTVGATKGRVFDASVIAVNKEPIVNPHTSMTNKWTKIYKTFQAVQRLSVVINDALGSQVLWYLAEGLMYYSESISDLIVYKTLTHTVQNAFYFTITFWIMYFASDICNQMEAVYSWLVANDNMNHVPVKESQVILFEMSVKNIGIRGNNYFTITFPFVMGCISSVVTFFVICVQNP